MPYELRKNRKNCKSIKCKNKFICILYVWFFVHDFSIASMHQGASFKPQNNINNTIIKILQDIDQSLRDTETLENAYHMIDEGKITDVLDLTSFILSGEKCIY